MEKVEPGYYRIEQAWSCALHIFFFSVVIYIAYMFVVAAFYFTILFLRRYLFG